MKEVKVTESFLTLNKEKRGCQDEETLDDCITRNYIDSIINTCGCLPFQIGLFNNEVCVYLI